MSNPLPPKPPELSAAEIARRLAEHRRREDFANKRDYLFARLNQARIDLECDRPDTALYVLNDILTKVFGYDHIAGKVIDDESSTV